MTEPLVSVIIPFYNTADYLAEAVDSILEQTYSNYELVLVDNCSNDGSTEIAQTYVGRDPRVRLVRNERFLTQVQNYNRALLELQAEARYCKILQADDKLYPRCLTEMVALAEANPSVGIVSSFRLAGNNVCPQSRPSPQPVLSGRDAGRMALIGDLPLFGSPTVLLLRADLVRARTPFYCEGRFFEDVDVVYELLQSCDFGFAPQILSFIREDPGSTWGRMRTYDPSGLAHFLQLKRYGRQFFDPSEYRDIGRKTERTYRRFLAEAFLRRTEPEFWAFHRKGLAEIDEHIARDQLVSDSVWVLCKYLLSPGAVALGIRRRILGLLDRAKESHG
jgi:glycosyltransferase involved in cell wall biosynthesis